MGCDLVMVYRRTRAGVSSRIRAPCSRGRRAAVAQRADLFTRQPAQAGAVPRLHAQPFLRMNMLLSVSRPILASNWSSPSSASASGRLASAPARARCGTTTAQARPAVSIDSGSPALPRTVMSAATAAAGPGQAPAGGQGLEPLTAPSWSNKAMRILRLVLQGQDEQGGISSMWETVCVCTFTRNSAMSSTRPSIASTSCLRVPERRRARALGIYLQQDVHARLLAPLGGERPRRALIVDDPIELDNGTIAHYEGCVRQYLARPGRWPCVSRKDAGRWSRWPWPRGSRSRARQISVLHLVIAQRAASAGSAHHAAEQGA